jgi:hypothetical protein
MDNQNDNQELNTTDNTQTMESVLKPKDGKTGPLIGSIIIILVILLGGLYYLDSIKNKVAENKTEEVPAEENSDDIAKIEAELNEVNPDDFDSDFDEIDAEFEATADSQ